MLIVYSLSNKVTSIVIPKLIRQNQFAENQRKAPFISGLQSQKIALNPENKFTK